MFSVLFSVQENETHKIFLDWNANGSPIPARKRKKCHLVDVAVLLDCDPIEQQHSQDVFPAFYFLGWKTKQKTFDLIKEETSPH